MAALTPEWSVLDVNPVTGGHLDARLDCARLGATEIRLRWCLVIVLAYGYWYPSFCGA